MLQCLRGKTLPLTVQLLKISPVCRRCFFSPVAVRLYHRPPTSRPVPMLTLSAFNLSGRLGLHTSSQRDREVRESVLITTVQRHWQEMKKTPKPAFVLGVAGAVPFVAPPLAMCFMHVYYPGLATAQVLYGACILSFLGGVRWGYTLPDAGPHRPNWANLVTGAVIPSMAFMSLLLMDSIHTAVMGLGMGFGIAMAVDVLGAKDLDLAPLGPLWYKWLRSLLTVIVLASLLTTLRCASRYPETRPIRTQQRKNWR
ncbi:PREDICTED: transmembrane protein 69 [Nanorana parkeri]|uniref:transmembrane protein 69 n=1 Tax=Nanorana parkeri TaxID=125878 RepID=UPI000854FCAD|nr:PREDICTED: transmembrane protein 69 [Nanorana parkeri]